jgi:hypothetical protein
MRLPKAQWQILAAAALTLWPSALGAGFVSGTRVFMGREPEGYYCFEMLNLDMGLLGSLSIGLYFQLPLADPQSRRGIFDERDLPRPRLWMLLVSIALIAPLLALWTQGIREMHH